MNWHIGQEIVCVDSKNLSTNRHMCPLKEGEIYKIVGLGLAHCGQIHIDVGIEKPCDIYECSNCGKTNASDVVYGWGFHERRFAPLEYDKEAIKELMENKDLTTK